MFLKFRRYIAYSAFRHCKFKGVVCFVAISTVLIVSYLNSYEDLVDVEDERLAAETRNDFTEAAGQETVEQQQSSNSDEFVSAVLVMSAKRSEALRNHMEQLVRLRPSAVKFPIIISQDGRNHDVATVATHFAKHHRNVSYMNLKSDSEPRPRSKNYEYIAAHYHWALDKVFNETRYDFVIITEDDLDIAKISSPTLHGESRFYSLILLCGAFRHGMITGFQTWLTRTLPRKFGGRISSLD